VKAAIAHVWALLYPLRLLFHVAHEGLYRASLVYNQFSLEEAQREWHGSNYYLPEKAFWTRVARFAHLTFFTSAYMLLTPASVAWTLLLPTAVSIILFEDWWRSGIFVTLLCFLPWKFPPGYPVTLFGV